MIVYFHRSGFYALVHSSTQKIKGINFKVLSMFKQIFIAALLMGALGAVVTTLSSTAQQALADKVGPNGPPEDFRINREHLENFIRRMVGILILEV